MIEAIRTRRSVRKFTGKNVEDEIVLQLLESARVAPSGHNTQPWRFIVVRSPETKRTLAKAAHGQSWMEAAPVFIVCVADVRCRIQDEPGLEVNETSPHFALKQVIRDTAIAVEHVVLEAQNLGLGTCWVGWYEQADVRPILGIPADKFVVAILPLGYPAETPGERPRKKLDEIVMFEKGEERSGKA